jgi:protein ATS1
MKIYAIGSNGSGQLGIGHKEDVSVPKEVLFDTSYTPTSEHVSQIVAGGNHTLLLIAGQLYCSGDYSSGACGLQSDQPQSTPHFQKALLAIENSSNENESKVDFCAASWEASFIVKHDSHGFAMQLYSLGTGNKGELGLGEMIFRSPKPQLIKDFPPQDTQIIDLAASVGHIVAVLSNGDVYGWGNGRKGQLGHPDAIVYSPRKISGIDFKVVKAVCGREFTYLLSKPEDGKHIVLGRDKWDIRSSAPPILKQWKQVAASWGSIFVLLDNGAMLSWGRDDHGQLAPPNLPELKQIAIGSEHALGYTALGEVLAWGWGEHGNCGPNTTNGNVKGRWNVIASSKYLPPESEIMSIASGCATSWICIDQ